MMTYAVTDWAGLGQFLLGIAAILALVLQGFNRKKLAKVGTKIDQVNQAVNNRPKEDNKGNKIPTISDEVAELSTIAKDTKDTVAQLVAGTPVLLSYLEKQDTLMNIQKSDLEELKTGYHRLQEKLEDVGQRVLENTSKVDNHLAFHQAKFEAELPDPLEMD